MDRKIIVGFDGSQQSADALVFGRQLQKLFDAELILATVVPFEMFNARVGEHIGERELAQKIFAQADQILTEDGPKLRKQAIADISPSRGLYHLAEDEHANILVIGSTHRGPIGQVLPGGDGERLLSHSPCAVAMVPHSFHEKVTAPLKVIGVAFDGSAESKTALRSAISLAKCAKAKLRVISIEESPLHIRFHLSLHREQPEEISVEKAQKHVNEALGMIPSEIASEGVVLRGEPSHELIRQSHDDLDLLFLGSRNYGPALGVLLGSVSRALMNKAECPIVIVPRGVENVF